MRPSHTIESWLNPICSFTDFQRWCMSQAVWFSWSDVTKITITEKLLRPQPYDVDKSVPQSSLSDLSAITAPFCWKKYRWVSCDSWNFKIALNWWEGHIKMSSRWQDLTIKFTQISQKRRLLISCQQCLCVVDVMNKIKDFTKRLILKACESYRQHEPLMK